jgi:hypothetical protein
LSYEGPGSSPKSLMRTTHAANHGRFCGGVCAWEMNFPWMTKCSPTCSKLPFLGPFNQNECSLSFTHETRRDGQWLSHGILF